jgi:glutamyl-tRNA reductase
MELIVFGLNHKTAPVSLREKLAISEEDQLNFGKQLKESGCEEHLFLSTCNRVELYGVCQNTASVKQELLAVLSKQGAVTPQELQEHLYWHEGISAITHLFRVASSLDSMVIGEPQILGQLKSAFDAAKQNQWLGQQLFQTCEWAFSIAKKVRNETGIAKNVVSISSVAVHLAKQIFDDLSDRVVLLVGAGEMGELAAQHLVQGGVSQLLVANRSLERAASLAEKLGGHPRLLDELPSLLVQADIVITSTGARDYLIRKEQMSQVLKARKYKPVFIIDIAVPRNVDPTLNSLEYVFVYDVDDLNQIAQENRANRQKEAELAEEMVKVEAQKYLKEHAKKELTPTIVALREKFNDFAQSELQQLSKVSGLSESQEKQIKQIAQKANHQLLHQVLTGLKTLADHPQKDQMLELVHVLFDLKPSTHQENQS